MKPIGAAVAIGVLVSFPVIYILRPLNTGAVALIVILCVGLCAGVGSFLAALLTMDTRKPVKIGCLVLVVVGLVLILFLLFSYLSVRSLPQSSIAVPVRAYLFVGEPT